jgi:hypothetical protein
MNARFSLCQIGLAGPGGGKRGKLKNRLKQVLPLPKSAPKNLLSWIIVQLFFESKRKFEDSFTQIIRQKKPRDFHCKTPRSRV